MALRILHTSDWHLGQKLKDHSRDHEHRRFLNWLLDVVEEDAVDAVLVAGDVFDRAVPPPSAMQLYYDFAVSMRERHPTVQLVIVGGNHDSASRLDAPADVLGAIGVTVVGGYEAGRRDRYLVPVTDNDGELAAWVLPVPFLRRSDFAGALSMAEGYGDIYRRAIDHAAAHCSTEHALIAMGHCHVAGGAMQESVRNLVRGNEEAVPASVFDGAHFTALGHLHLAQEVAPNVRYCGSPIPLSMSEAGYSHQVNIAHFEGAELVDLRTRHVPRVAPFRRFTGTLDEVVAAIEGSDLPPADAAPSQHAFVDAVVTPTGNERINEAVRNAFAPFGVRIVRVGLKEEPRASSLRAQRTRAELATLTPMQVFERMHEERRGGPAGAELRSAFEALLMAPDDEVEEAA